MVRRSARVLVVAALLVGLLLAAAPAQAGGGCHQPLSDRRGTTVEMRDLCFEPTVLRVAPEQTVTWVNRDAGVDHPVSAIGGAWGADGGGAAQAVRFDQAGVYPYFCHVHLGMIGVVVVGHGNAEAAGPGVPVQVGAPPAAAVADPPAGPSGSPRAPLLAGAALLALAAVLASWRARAARHPRSDDRT